MYGFKPGAMPKDKGKGGKIQGPGTGTSDSIKTEIPKGSYIMPADSTQQIGPQSLGELGQPVPVNVSSGEFQMPPEQVHAVGVQALNQMRDATHTPVAAGFKPQKDGLYFADGGSPAEEERRRLPRNPLAVTYGDMTGRPSARTATQPQQAATVMPSVSYGDLQRTPSLPRPSAPNPSGAINTAVEARPRAQVLEQAPAQVAELGTEPDQAPQRAPASFASMQREPSIPRAGQPRPMPQGEPVTVSDLAQGFRAGGQAVADRVAGAGRAAVSGAADAAAGFRAGGQEATNQIAAAGRGLAQAAGGALGQAFPNTLTAVRGAGQNIGEAYQAGGFPAAVGATVRNTLVPAIGFSADVGRSAKQALDPFANALKTAVTGNPTPIEGTRSSAAQPSPAATTPSATVPASAPAAQGARAGYGFTPDPMQGPALGMRVSPTSAPEIKRIDNAPGLNSPLFTNLPTGEAVSGMQGGTVNTVPAFRAPAQPSGAPMGFSAEREGPAGGVIGAGRTEQDRYGALMREVARLSQGGRAGRNKAAALVSAYQAAQRGEEADMRDQAGMRELGFRQEDAATRNALNARELQERSADRTGRFALDERRLAGDERMRGFEARGLERTEKLYSAYENAKTPEERSAIAEQIRALRGIDRENTAQVIYNEELINPAQPMAGTRRVPMLLNRDGTATAVTPRATQNAPDGMRYVGTSNGKPVYEDQNGRRFVQGGN